LLGNDQARLFPVSVFGPVVGFVEALDAATMVELLTQLLLTKRLDELQALKESEAARMPPPPSHAPFL
jgi:hypothetical protein